MTKENRAWFIAKDARILQTLYVMYDQELNQPWEIDFKQGNELNLSQIGIIKFNVEKTKWADIDYIRKWDFLPNSAGVPLANAKALKLLEEIAPGEFQAIPTEIIMPDGYIIKEYKLINVTKKVPVLLLEHSIIDLKSKVDDFGLTHYKTLYHSLDALGNSNLAREQKLDVSVIYGSSKLMEAIKAANLIGLVFRDQEGRHKFWHEPI